MSVHTLISFYIIQKSQTYVTWLAIFVLYFPISYTKLIISSSIAWATWSLPIKPRSFILFFVMRVTTLVSVPKPAPSSFKLLAQIISQFLEFNFLSEYEFWGGDFIRYYFPDFLWGYALTSALYIIYPPREQRKNFWVPLCAFFVGFCYEVGQWKKIFLGTGDFADVLIYLYAAFAAYKIHLIYYKRRKKQ